MASDGSKIAYDDQARFTQAQYVVGRRAAVDRDASRQCRDVLDQLLRQTVISRLRLAHSDGVETRRPGERGTRRRIDIDTAVVDRIAHALRFGDQAEVDRLVEDLLDDTHTPDTLLLDVVPVVDRWLREAGAADGDLADITLAQWRLVELVERLAPRLQPVAGVARHGRRALLSTPEPGLLRLRLQIMAECLNRDGWDAWCETRGAMVGIFDTVRADWFSMVVIASDAGDTDVIGGTIRALRRASCNPDLRVLVISAGLAKRPDRMARLGADAAAADVRLATVQAQRLLALMLAPV